MLLHIVSFLEVSNGGVAVGSVDARPDVTNLVPVGRSLCPALGDTSPTVVVEPIDDIVDGHAVYVLLGKIMQSGARVVGSLAQ